MCTLQIAGVHYQHSLLKLKRIKGGKVLLNVVDENHELVFTDSILRRLGYWYCRFGHRGTFLKISRSFYAHLNRSLYDIGKTSDRKRILAGMLKTPFSVWYRTLEMCSFKRSQNKFLKRLVKLVYDKNEPERNDKKPLSTSNELTSIEVNSAHSERNRNHSWIPWSSCIQIMRM